MEAGTHWLGLSHLVYWSLSSEGLIRSVHVMSSLTHTLSKIRRSDRGQFQHRVVCHGYFCSLCPSKMEGSTT